MKRRLLSLIALLGAALLLIGAGSPSALDLRIAGLLAPVHITYDQMGVPNIYAANTHDLFMAQGYVHAADRWWQMDVTRRRGSGRVSEILGADYVDSDTIVRAMNLPAVAARDLQLLSPETRALLDAYSAGVNAWWVGKNPEDAVLEYHYLAQGGQSGEIEPWSPLDTMLLQAVQSFGSDQTSLGAELAKTKVEQVGGGLAAALIVPSYPYGINPTVLHPGATTHDETTATPAAFTLPALQERLELPSFDTFGSNSWVLSGRRTTTGKPLLENDSHWGVEMPSSWYEVGLHCAPVTSDCPYDAFGFSFAGAPGIVVGHNDHIAWGLTNAFNDVVDVFLLEMNPADAQQYRFDGAYVNLETRSETIPVYGSDPAQIEITTSRFGTVFTSLYGLDVGQPFAVRWAADDGNRSLDSVLLLDHAANWDEFQAALAYFDLPGLHVTYADTDGNIGYLNSGRIARRVSGRDGSVGMLAAGSADDWQGYVDPSENPRLFNPPSGYIVSANNAAALPGDFPFTLATFQDYGARAARIEQLLQAEPTQSPESVAQMQMDAYNPAAALVVPVLASLDLGSADLNDAAAWLAQWDFQNTVDSPQAALFNVLWTKLMHLALEELPIYEGSHDIYLMSNMIQGVHPLWANAARGYTFASRNQVLSDSLQAALEWMRQTYGTDRDAWKWGDLHVTHFDTLLPERYGAGAQFNRSVPTPGGWGTLNTSEWDMGKEDYSVGKIASMRMIADLSNLSASRFVNSTGESGDPRSPHYDDMIPLWVRGAYQPPSQTEMTLTLNPE